MHQDSARVKDSRRNRKPINRRQALPELLANLSQEDLGALVTELVQQQPELDDRIRTALARPPAVQKQRRKRPNH